MRKRVELENNLAAALERIVSAADTDAQADKEILRYWNERVGQVAKKDATFVRKLRAAIVCRLQTND